MSRPLLRTCPGRGRIPAASSWRILAGTRNPIARTAPLLLWILANLAATTRTTASEMADASKLFQAHRVPEARAILEQMDRQGHSSAESLALLGKCQTLMQDKDTAVGTYERALALRPAKADLLIDYGELCIMLAESERSLSLARKGRNALVRAEELAPENLDVPDALAQFYFRAPWFAGGDRRKAFEEVKKVRRLNPKRGLVLFAMLKTEEGKASEVFDACLAAAKEQPNSYSVQFELGKAAALVPGQVNVAIRAFEKCLSLKPEEDDPPSSEVLLRLGKALVRANHLVEARAILQKGAKEDPSDDRFARELERLAR